MATTVAVNYGPWWRVYGTTANICKWLRDNHLTRSDLVVLAYDYGNTQFEAIAYGTGYTTSVA